RGDFWEEASNSAGAQNLPVPPGDVLAVHISIGQARDFLDKLIPWLREPKERRLIVFLENPSELRPGGGFLGSYAEMTVVNGGLKNISIYDMNEPDRKLDTKTVPPKPLQAIVTNWRAADANWFFDFSDSARKTLSFLGASGTYRDTSLDGAVGISAKVVEDLLGLTDPIMVASGTIEIRPDNFLYQIQGEVQKGQAQKAEQPKKVLQELTPVLMAKIADLSDEQKAQMTNLIARWISDGDMRIYFTNPDFQRFVEGLSAGGRIYDIPRNWNGVYLAFNSANIGGGKTDIFIEQDVKVETQIRSEGWLNDHIVVTRKHGAEKSDPWWYREINRSYFQIFTNYGTNLSYADGGSERKITPRVNYIKEKYQIDPDVDALEKTEKQLEDYPFIKTYSYRDKKIFSTWLNVEPGKSIQFTADLDRRAVAAPEAGMVYDFILEKQPGSQGDYYWQIMAPVGFKFKENNLPIYEYRTADMPARWTIRLTLEKI
ncbi:MAG TPA: DUF4012 domain-containing protein, partial [Candidatus Paceibacterota bacterium]